MRKFLSKSPWVYHVNSGSCGGCEAELIASLGPRYDAERAGIKLVGSPGQADILLVTGPVTKQMSKQLKSSIYGQVLHPKAVVCLGNCGISSGVYDGAYSIEGGVDKVMPVDVCVAGCPPRPEAVVAGILKAALKISKGKKEKPAEKVETKNAQNPRTEKTVPGK